MLTMLQGWEGKVELNGELYNDVQAATNACNVKNGTICIKLLPRIKTPVIQDDRASHECVITVKKYMTQPASSSFDFMLKWNNNIPMPLRTMVGTVEKETKGMVYMKLRGDVYTTKIHTCMKCGRKLTNKVSQYFGIGPECGNHNYVNPFDTEEELKEAVKQYRTQLQAITWEGWIIKSAITDKEEV